MTMTQTPEDFRAKAAEAEAERQASWERSDTDGFVSQAASGIMAAKYRAEADLAESGGYMEFRVPFLLNGAIASTHLHYGEWGPSWVLNDDAAKVIGKRFVKESDAMNAQRRYSNNAKKGIRFGTIRVKGYVTLSGGGKGTGGMCNVLPVTLPVMEDLKAGKYTVVATDNFVELPHSYDAKSF